MKKFIAIIICSFILISVFAVSAFAMEIKPYVRVINFSNTNKSYPIGDSVENAIPFFEYYSIPIDGSATFQFSYQGGYTSPADGQFQLDSREWVINCTYPPFSYNLKANDNITDFAIIYIDNDFKVINYNGSDVYIHNGSQFFIDNLGTQLNNDFSPNYSGFTLDNIFSLTVLDGHYIQFPRTNHERIVPSVFNTVLPSLGAFVVGIGSSFVNGFSSVFMTDGSINVLGIFILVLFGVSLGYGVIRWITGLFRKE